MATSATTYTNKQQKEQRTKQLTTLTVLMLTMLTVLINMPAQSTAASLFDAKKMSSISTTTAATITVLDAKSDLNNNNLPTVLQQLAESGDSGHRVGRKRLRKRHMASLRLSKLAQDANDETMPLEWMNACGVQEVVPHMALTNRTGNSKYIREQLKSLMNALRYEKTEFVLPSKSSININDIHSWRLYNRKYKFLPSLKRNAKIELRHWYRDMQKFVASFAELGVKKYRWDQANHQRTSGITHELNALLTSAKRVLCQVEDTFNATQPQANLPRISREQMQKKLKFATNDENRDAKEEVDPIDLKFAKQRYYTYVRNMLSTLRRRLKGSKKLATKAEAKSLASSASLESNSQWAALAQSLNDSESELSESEISKQSSSGA